MEFFPSERPELEQVQPLSDVELQARKSEQDLPEQRVEEQPL
jgi:hypothetical protein